MSNSFFNSFLRPPAVKIPPARLSEDLLSILHQADGKNVSFNQILRTTRGRGFPLVMIFLTLPFLFPLPLPGVSQLIGFTIAFMGLRIAVGKRPLIPRRLLKKQISFQMLEKAIRKAVPFIRFIEKRLNPRLQFLQRWPSFRFVNGSAILLGGFALMLPFPPIYPLTNFFPALAIICLSIGIMEEDGLFILFGYVATLGTWIYFYGLLVLSHKGISWIWNQWT